MIKQKRGRNKKAIFFSLDALIALIVILLSITVIYPIIKYSQKESYIPEDIISSLSALKIGDMENSQVTAWISEGKITNLDKSVLEQIGEFYVSNDPAVKDMARLLAEEVLSTINTNENIGIYYDGKLLASQNKTSWENAKDRAVERQIISGIKEGEEITGYSARAFLTNSVQTKYYYFGGYVGEGDIALNVDYSGRLTKIELEVAANKQFNICINGECSGSFAPAPSELEPKNFPDLNAYIAYFTEGSNTFELVPADGKKNFHVAGGYLKLTYEDGVQYEQPVKYYFTGIDGVINLYDGFYVPGDLNNLEVHLKAKVDDAAKKMYMKLGDTLIFSRDTGGNLINIDYDDAQIRSILSTAGKDYSDYSKKTIPIRIGIEGVDYEESEVTAEIFSDVMLSGSSNSVNVKATVDGVPYNKIEAVKRTNKKLVDILLDLSRTYVGLVPTKDGSVYTNGYHELSTDGNSLKSKIDNWVHGTGNKDFCAGIQRSIDEFTPDSDFRAIILSVFDPPNQCTIWETDPEFIAGGTTLYERIKTRVCKLALENNVRFYTIEMNLGDSVPAQETRAAIQAMANCSGGKYVKADDLDGGLMDAYTGIITEIKDLIYEMQTIDIIESADASSYLSPDSYLEFDYTKTEVPYGIVISSEKMFDNEDSGSFDVPADSDIVETKIVSYSGSKWTKDIKINEDFVYNLDDYGSDYTELGDPYAINIPNSVVESHNNIELRTATTPIDIFPGSPFNKIIYTVVKKMNSFSQIASSADGCVWNVEFEDGTYSAMSIPAEAAETCYYHNIDNTVTITCEIAPGVQGDCEYSDDALKIAIYNLFKKLDFDEDGRLDTKFEEQSLKVSSSEITGIPFSWETEAQVRKWW